LNQLEKTSRQVARPRFRRLTLAYSMLYAARGTALFCSPLYALPRRVYDVETYRCRFLKKSDSVSIRCFGRFARLIYPRMRATRFHYPTSSAENPSHCSNIDLDGISRTIGLAARSPSFDLILPMAAGGYIALTETRNGTCTV